MHALMRVPKGSPHECEHAGGTGGTGVCRGVAYTVSVSDFREPDLPAKAPPFTPVSVPIVYCTLDLILDVLGGRSAEGALKVAG